MTRTCPTGWIMPTTSDDAASEAVMKLELKRVYEPAAKDDGLRVLVDRLWPRGLTKEEAAVDLSLKEIAPSAALRRWFGHDPKRWKEFRRRYWAELAAKPSLIRSIRDRLLNGRVTLLYGARDATHNQAYVIKQFIEAA